MLVPFGFFSCTGAENNICCTKPGAFPPAPRHKSGTELDGGRGNRVGGDEGDDGVDLEVTATDVHVRRWPYRAAHEGHWRMEVRRRIEIAMNGWDSIVTIA